MPDGAELVGIDPEDLERLIARLALRFDGRRNGLGRADDSSHGPQIAADQGKARHGSALSNDFLDSLDVVVRAAPCQATERRRMPTVGE